MKFEYRATEDQGRSQKGTILAASEEAALRVLDRHGLYITWLKAVKRESLYGKQITLFDRIPEKDVMLFSRQLSIMFKARVSLVDALNTIGNQLKNKGFRQKVLKIAHDVEAGVAFSSALEKHPQAFSAFYFNMVKRGEALGKLSDVLNYLADHLEREHQIKSKIKGALVYPIFVVGVAFIVITLLAILVLPNLTRILEETGQELPLITQLVIALSNFYRQWWWLVLLIGAGFVVGAARLAKTRRGSHVAHWLMLQTPLLGGFMRMVYVSRFGENLSTLITGGVPIVEALGITGKIVGNETYAGIIKRAQDAVAQGSGVGMVFEDYPREFPPIFTQMIKVGEQSGALDETLSEIVGFYRDEMNRRVDTFIGLIEPLLIVALGLLVGGVMVSLMLPLYQSLSTGI